VRGSRATSRTRSRSSSASPCSTSPSATGFPPTWSPSRRRFRTVSFLPDVEALIRASRADLRLGGDKALYSPTLDYIQVPRPEAYFEPINWHRTALHELGHWSGAPNRLGRDLSGSYGSKSYAREELVAEMTAAFTCATLGITPTVRHADYIGSWLEIWRGEHNSSQEPM